MLTDSFTFSSAWLLGPLLVAVILYDMRFMRLPNTLALLFVLVFVAGLPAASSLQAVGWQVVAAVLVFCAGLAANAAGLWGGGDVKILSALVLNIPVSGLLMFFFALCACLFFGILALQLLRRALHGRTGWQGLNEQGRYPVGLSIGFAGLIYLALA